MSAAAPHLSPEEIEALYIAAVELDALAGRNAMARHVSADLARLAAAAEVGPSALGEVLRRFAWDDAIDHLEFQSMNPATRAAFAAARDPGLPQSGLAGAP
jgi:hypothetical protein